MSQQVFDPVIDQAKAHSDQTGTKMEEILSQWEQGNAQLTGLLVYYQSIGGAAPPPVIPAPAVPAPVAAAPTVAPVATAQASAGDVTDYAREMLMRLATTYNEDFNRLVALFQNSHVAIAHANGLSGQTLDDQAVLFVQCKIQDEKSGNNASFEFIMLRHVKPYQRDSKDKQPHPTEPGGTIEVVTKKWTAGGHGIFRRKMEDGSIDSRLGSLVIWNEEVAQKFGGLKTYTTYRGELDFKNHPYSWQVSVNNSTDFHEAGPVNPAEINLEARDLAQKTGKLVTPHQLKHYQLNKDGEILFIEGRIGSAWTGTTKKGNPKGTIKLMEASHNQEVQLFPAFCPFYDQVSDIYTYGESSHVIIAAEVNPPATVGRDPFVSAKWQIPVMVIPGAPPNQPNIPAAYTPPTQQ